MSFRVILTGGKGVGKTRFLHRLLGFMEENAFHSTLEPETVQLPGPAADVECVDTPALTSLFSAIDTESDVRRLLFSREYDLLCHVMDVRHLLRSTALFHQLTALEKPMCIVLSGIGPALDADAAAIARDLGAPVLLADAPREELLERFLGIVKTVPPPPPCKLVTSRLAQEREALPEAESLSPGQMLLSVLESFPGDPPPAVAAAARRLARNNPFLRNDLFFADFSFQLATRQIAAWKQARPQSQEPVGWAQRFGLWAQQPLTGIPIVLGLLALMYLFVGILGAQILVDAIEKWVFAPVLEPFFAWFSSLFPGNLVHKVLLDENFGMIPTGLFLVLGIVFPVLLTYYTFVGLLENAGYFPRLSVLLDRAMRPMGLNGKGVMPLVMGFSCVTMAIMTTRMLDTRKERIIASLLLVMGMPCAPLLSTMFIILGQLPFAATLVLFGILFSQIFMAGFLASRILPGEHSELIIEIPPLKAPDVGWVLRLAWGRTLAFMREATPLFLAASLFLLILNELGFIRLLQAGSAPIVEHFWGLPADSVQVFLKTFIRRENGVAELARLKEAFTGNQMLITLLLMTFLMPCINATLMLFKEHGARIALAIIGTVLVYTVLMGGVVNYGLQWAGVQW